MSSQCSFNKIDYTANFADDMVRLDEDGKWQRSLFARIIVASITWWSLTKLGLGFDCCTYVSLPQQKQSSTQQGSTWTPKTTNHFNYVATVLCVSVNVHSLLEFLPCQSLHCCIFDQNSGTWMNLDESLKLTKHLWFDYLVLIVEFAICEFY